MHLKVSKCRGGALSSPNSPPRTIGARVRMPPRHVGARMARMERTLNRLFFRRERRNLLSRSIRLIAFNIVVLLTLETTSLAGAQQSPAPITSSVQSQGLQQTSAQQSANSPRAITQDARNESADSLPSAPS